MYHLDRNVYNIDKDIYHIDWNHAHVYHSYLKAENYRINMIFKQV